ncbi:SAM-dependent methyltransferase [Kribbella sp. NPDC020789]
MSSGRRWSGDRSGDLVFDQNAWPAGMQDTLHYSHSAWLWNYLAGGKDNQPLDRYLGDELNKIGPGWKFTELVQANHGFVHRAVNDLYSRGIVQFIDLGAGIPVNPYGVPPTDPSSLYGNALRTHPDARVVYVDHDPLVLTHARGLRDVAGQVGVIEADIFEPKQVLDHPVLYDFVDRDKAVGLICTGVLHEHNGPVEEVAEVMAAYAAWLPANSFTVISHLLNTEDDDTKTIVEPMQALLQGNTGRGRFRTLNEIKTLFPGQDILAPGVIECRRWPDLDVEEEYGGWSGIAGGIGCVR